MIGGGDVAELQPDRPRGLAQRARGLRHSLTQNIDTTTPSGKLIAFRFCAKRYALSDNTARIYAFLYTSNTVANQTANERTAECFS
jgi:hypothetical protein